MDRMADHYSLNRCMCGCRWILRYVKSWFLMMLLMTSTVAPETCNRAMTATLVVHQGCVPKRVVTFTCQGQCVSYVRPSTDNPAVLERFCSCCDEDSTRTVQLGIWCPGLPGRPTKRLRLEMPLSCRCRPCTDTPHVTPEEERQYGIWRSTKRSKTNMDKQYHKSSTLTNTYRTLKEILQQELSSDTTSGLNTTAVMDVR